VFSQNNTQGALAPYSE